jgi:hypothetical protein
MAETLASTPRKKRPVSHKRVLIVLCSLVATLTLSATFLLALEGVAERATGAAPTMLAPTAAGGIGAGVELREKPWDFIIVYESGNVTGNAVDLTEGRFKGGNGTESAIRPGANFHFVVDSAKSAKGGYVVKGSAWLSQKTGAPNVGWPVNCNNSNVYTNAVGVCFVGDVIKAKATNQAQELVNLVREIQTLTNIPADRVKFQWEPLEAGSSKPSPAQQAFADEFRKALRP